MSNPSFSLKANLSGDLWGGFAAMLVALPSAIAFGVTIFAPLGSEFGAKGALAGMLGVTALGLIAALFGGTQRLISAPCAPAAAVLSATVIQYASSLSAGVVVLTLFLITLLSSLMQISFGFLRIGRLMRYMPYTVVSGYLSGVGLIVIFSQIPKWLAAPKGTNWWQTLTQPSLWQMPSLYIGLATCAAMVWGPKLTTKIPAVIMGLAGGIATYWLLAFSGWPELMNSQNNPYIIGHLSADMQGMMESIKGPWVNLLHGPLPHWDQIVIPALTLAVLLSIDTLKTCLVLDALTGSRHDSNRELIGQGLGNLTATLVGGAPGAGTMGATLVNKASGGETFMSGVFQGVWALLAIAFLTPLISWVPSAALAALLMVIGYRMIDWHSLALIKSRDTWLDLLVIVSVVLVANTISLIAASGLGILLATLMFISEQIHSVSIRSKSYGNQRFSKRMRTVEERAVLEQAGKSNVYVELQGSLFFGTTDQLYLSLEAELQGARYLLLDFHRVQSLDFTAGHMIERLQKSLEQNHAHLVLTRLPQHTVTGKDLKTYIDHVGIQESAYTHLFDDFADALEWIENETIHHSDTTFTQTRDAKLEEFELFNGLSAEELHALNQIAVERHFKKGDRIFTMGEPGQELMLISKGLVRISLLTKDRQEIHLSTMGKGQFFGEISFIDRQNHSAQAIAEVDARLICISRDAFDAVSQSDQVISAKVISCICLSLAARLRHTNSDLRHLMEE